MNAPERRALPRWSEPSSAATEAAAQEQSQPSRLAAGGLIDRSRSLSFRFDGVTLRGYAGDTLASALLANGVTLVGRSFKYHRPRGVLSAGVEEPNALVELRSGARREPNTRATTIELFDGLVARSQNRFPSLRFDLGAVAGLFSPLLAAGFYYKTFMWPASFWERVYEPLIRRAAGLGRASNDPDPDRYERSHLFCDVLVIGAGPAGLMAALSAARSGARVVLLEEDRALGGRLLAEAEQVGGLPAWAWAEQVGAELAAMPRVRVLTRTSAFALLDHGVVAALERVSDHLPEPPPFEPRQRFWTIVARSVVLATGAIERSVVFPGNDRPGVMLAGAVRSYLNRHAVLPGRSAVILAAADEALRTAQVLERAGASVAAAIVPSAERSNPLAQALGRLGARVVAGGAVVATSGWHRLRSVRLRDETGRAFSVEADLLAMGGGWNPSVQLACHLGHKPRWDDQAAAFVPATLPPRVHAAGAVRGAATTHAALAQGREAGLAAAERAGFSGALPELPAAEDAPRSVPPLFRMARGRGKAFVDFQHDVTDSDIALAYREGFRASEHVKRYTTHGMATDQGKSAGVAGLVLLAQLSGRSIAATGTTTARPPWTPVTIGAIAGPHRGKSFRPARLTPTHAWAEAHGAAFAEIGLWYRAQWYRRPGESGWRDSVDREVLTVRRAVGIADVSTLGKIEVVGPDAARLLDLVYANTMSTLRPGRIRYGLMLREDGFVLDDGTVARLAEDRFFLTTTTANAARVMQHLEFCHEVLRPELDVSLLSVTDAWAQLSVAGPKARALLTAVIDPGQALDDRALPHMGFAEARVGGVSARLYRLSFSGERAYEIGVPADHGEALMEKLVALGAPLGAAAYGTEAIAALRIEKGHPAGAELNGQTTARDLGLDRLIAADKDCIGKALANRPALIDPERPCLVGLRPADGRTQLRAGAHLLRLGAKAQSQNDEGWITSACFSPTLGHPIALALLARGRERHGERVRVYDALRGGDTEAIVCPPVFYDPEGKQTRG
jgi:heterotetrameric sarcosine oxidase alpha subunit